MVTKGSAALAAILDGRGKQNQLATELQTKPPVIMRWRTGESKPDSENRAVLEDKLGIPWRSWDEPTEVDTRSIPNGVTVAAIGSALSNEEAVR